MEKTSAFASRSYSLIITKFCGTKLHEKIMPTITDDEI
jgi:hypothetical protein